MTDRDRKPLYAQVMTEEEARSRDDRLIFIMTRVDVWMLRLILVLLLILIAAQVYIAW